MKPFVPINGLLLLVSSCHSESIQHLPLHLEVATTAQGVTLVNRDSFKYRTLTFVIRSKRYPEGYYAIENKVFPGEHIQVTWSEFKSHNDGRIAMPPTFRPTSLNVIVDSTKMLYGIATYPIPQNKGK
jgi:hypothetical protein